MSNYGICEHLYEICAVEVVVTQVMRSTSCSDGDGGQQSLEFEVVEDFSSTHARNSQHMACSELKGGTDTAKLYVH